MILDQDVPLAQSAKEFREGLLGHLLEWSRRRAQEAKGRCRLKTTILRYGRKQLLYKCGIVRPMNRRRLEPAFQQQRDDGRRLHGIESKPRREIRFVIQSPLDHVPAQGGWLTLAPAGTPKTLAEARDGGRDPDLHDAFYRADVDTRTPTTQDTIVLFAQPLMDATTGSRTEYQSAALTLQLASAVAQADGIFHEREVEHLRQEIDAWGHLTLAERRRLHAHLQWLTLSPMSLATLKKKLEPLPATSREALATFMATLAQADGVVSPEEVKFLEKVYKALGVEPKKVFSDIHAAGSGGTSAPHPQNAMGGFRLDAARIAALHEDTARVSALLSRIFTEEGDGTQPPEAATPEPELELDDKAGTTLGLDQDHSALLRLILSRPEWSRAELEDAAADLDLMLDGAMEQINEAAFETFNEPLFEGDDPISVNTQLLEKIEA